MRAILSVLTFALTTAPALAQAPAALSPSAISAEVAQKGIGAVLERLRSQATTTPDERFALAGLEFLAAVEATYQWRMRHHVGAEWRMLFGMGADLPSDHSGALFPPEELEGQAKSVLAAMERVQPALEGLAEGPAYSLTLALSDLWFDVDGDGKRAEWEGAGALLDGVAYVRAPGFDPDGNPLPQGDFPVIRFDNADAAWLAAYAHLIAGGAELLLAFDPTPSLQKVWEARRTIDRFRPADGSPDYLLGSFDAALEPIAAALDLLRHQPDALRTQKVKAHWQQTISQNRLFWTLVEAERDNAGEWIPNNRQVSATGLEFPQGTGAAWLQVLDDGAALLDGTKTIPFWRAPIGLDLGKWLDNPTPLPLDGVIQGWAVAEFFSDAPAVTPESIARFNQMFMNSSPFLAMVMIN